jgi:RNA polymerase sigma factor (sigma-70 family)
VDVDIQACVSGDKRAWDHFVRRTSSIIYAAVYRACGSKPGARDDVDDRVQDVYIRLIRNDYRLLRTYDASRASLSTWLTLVSRSVVYEHFQKRSLNTVAIESAHDLASPQASSESHGVAKLPAAALEGLTDRQRLVLRMLFDEGMSVEEAARRMDVDPQTIRSTKHKALTRLRQQFPSPTEPEKQGFSSSQGDVSPETP